MPNSVDSFLASYSFFEQCLKIGGWGGQLKDLGTESVQLSIQLIVQVPFLYFSSPVRNTNIQIMNCEVNISLIF